MSDPTNKTERAQIDALVEIKEEEIDALKELRKQYDDDDYVPETQTPAEVAQDPNADDADRVAAANAVLGQDPATVNAEQSEPSPSTHAEQFEEKESEESTDEETVEETSETTTEDEKVEKSEDKDASKSKKAANKKS